MKTTLTVLLIMELYELTSCLFNQHFFVNQQMTWNAVQQHCKTYFYDLSTFTNEKEEEQFLKDAVNQTSNAWIGLHKEYQSDNWEWAGGEVATNISWDIDHKETKTDQYSFLHKDSKKLNSKGLNDQLLFFCMAKSVFILVPQNQSWEEALEYCRYNYSDLASLSSWNRMDSALRTSTEAQAEIVWTGLRFLAGEWFWVSGDDLDYKAWPQDGQPQCPARNLRCGALDKNMKIWTPRDCEEKLNFICSVQAVGGTSPSKPSGTHYYSCRDDNHWGLRWWG